MQPPVELALQHQASSCLGEPPASLPALACLHCSSAAVGGPWATPHCRVQCTAGLTCCTPPPSSPSCPPPSPHLGVAGRAEGHQRQQAHQGGLHIQILVRTAAVLSRAFGTCSGEHPTPGFLAAWDLPPRGRSSEQCSSSSNAAARVQLCKGLERKKCLSCDCSRCMIAICAGRAVVTPLPLAAASCPPSLLPPPQGGGLVCAAEQQDGRRPQEDPDRGAIHGGGGSGRGAGGGTEGGGGEGGGGRQRGGGAAARRRDAGVVCTWVVWVRDRTAVV